MVQHDMDPFAQLIIAENLKKRLQIYNQNANIKKA